LPRLSTAPSSARFTLAGGAGGSSAGMLALTVVALAYALYEARQPPPVRVHLTLGIPPKGHPGYDVGSGIAAAVRQAFGDLEVTTQVLRACQSSSIRAPKCSTSAHCAHDAAVSASLVCRQP
jgi:hypothetical protein